MICINTYMKIFIYEATNIINGKKYYGQTINLEKRKSEHFCNSTEERIINLPFRKALKKYGKNNFSWKIVAEAEEQKKANELEQYYIDNFGDYNIAPGGIGGRVFLSPEGEKERTRKILESRNKWSKEYKEKVYSFTKTIKFREEASIRNKGKNNYWYGKRGFWSGKKNPEHSKRMKGRTHIVSEDTKRKISENFQRRKDKGDLGLKRSFYTLFHSKNNETKKLSFIEWIKNGIDVEYVQKTSGVTCTGSKRRSKGWEFIKKENTNDSNTENS